ncbi:MAG TPA: efflux RND transporter periplasmic adaptor subunit [Vicinamibacterales bacterium]|nr:efflux RND transporter periplasmic adaptor subunit [Vicinamibacterales bacterium]
MAHPIRLDRSWRPRAARRPAVLALAAALLAGLAGACAKTPAEQPPVVTVQTAVAERASIADIVSADAVLYPLTQAAIVPKISAPVERFYVNRGQRVRAGQVLVVLEHQDLAAAAMQNKGIYEQAQASDAMTRQASLPAQVQAAQLAVVTSKKTLDAQQRVYTDRAMLLKQGAIPQRDLETAGVALAQAQSQYEQAVLHLNALHSVTRAQTLKAADAQLTAARGQYDAAEALLNYATIRSPIDGWVTDRPFYAGEMATAGTPLLTVMDTSSVVARVLVTEGQAARVAVGDLATLTVPGFARPVAGKVTIVSPALDPSSTTLQIWVQVPNRDGRLKPGTSVRVAIVTRTVDQAVVIPSAALLTDATGARSVMVVGRDGSAHTRAVDIGITEDGRVQITKGLTVGETVVTTGAYGLPDGTRVKVQAASAPESGRSQEP